jgi:hypothetical protein
LVLVERKRFESLARRMGAMECQLADLEAASLPPLSDLGSMGEQSPTEQVSRALDDVFTIPELPNRSKENDEDVSTEKNAANASRWSLLGAIPSYGEHQSNERRTCL